MSLSKYEIYVKALLEGYEELREKRYYGLWHVSDILADLEEAMRIADLTDKQRQALHLRYFEHKEQSEVAELLQVSQPTAKQHIDYAIKKIANIYEQWEASNNVSETI